MSIISNVSYLFPRDPSFIGPGRPLPTSRKCLNPFLIPEQPKDPVQVYLRIKPAPPNDGFVKPEEPTFSIADPKTLVTKHLKTTSRGKSQMTHQYSFTEIFDGGADQKQLFERCAQESVREFVSGKNALMFAYGTTNAGKTHTMMGSIEKPGIIPRSIDIVFTSVGDKLCDSCRFKPDKVCSVIEQDAEDQAADMLYRRQILEWSSQVGETSTLGRSTMSSTSDTTSDGVAGQGRTMLDLTSDSNCSDFISYSFREMQGRLRDEPAAHGTVVAPDDVLYSVWISFSEVYNENIYDLLDEPGARKMLGLGLDGMNNVYVKGLRHVFVRTGDEAYQVLLYGQNNLRSAPTNLNHTSSRSHCIFTIKLVRSPNTHAPTHAGVSTFSFCDLAGSERCKKTMNVGARLKESQNINTSLVVLGRCISNIRDNQKLRVHDRKPVPFRDSKLTRLFQRALLGHERVSMVVNVSTEPLLFSETSNVLAFSAVARQILLVPLRRKKHPALATRFSVIAVKHSKRRTIAWDNPDEHDENENDDSTATEASRHESVAVSRLVAQLKRELQDEKARSLTLETNLRKELADRFATILQGVQENYKKQVQEVEQRQDKVLSWHMRQTQEYYNGASGGTQRAAKRRRCSDSDADETMDSTVLLESEPEVPDLDPERTSQEVEALTELNADAVETNRLLKIDNSRLQFELADAKVTLLAANKIIDVVQESPDSDAANVLIRELNAQVTAEKEKNQNLKTLLDEAKMEFEDLREQNAVLGKDLAEADSELAEKEIEVEELTQSLAECRQLLAQKAELLEVREAEVSRLNATVAGLKPLAQKNKELLVTISAHEQEINQLRETIDANGDLTSRNKSLIESVSKATNQLTEDRDRLSTENAALRERVAALETELEGHAACAERSAELSARVEQLEDVNRTASSTASSLEGDCARREREVEELEREVKAQLQVNAGRGKEVQALERELKDTVKAMNGAETELQLHKDRVKELTMQWQCEVRNLQAQLLTEKNNSELASQLVREGSRAELATLREENEQLADKIAAMTTDMSSFEERRDKQFKLYEDMLRQKREEVDCQKREVRGLQEVLYKNTPTPKKDQVNQLKEDVRIKDQKINELTILVNQLTVSKTHPSAVKSKENAEPVETASAVKRNGRQTRKVVIPTPDINRVVVKEEPVSSEKKSRTRKKLFTQKGEILDIPLAPSPAPEQQYNGKTPADLVRTLRSRRN